MLETGTSSMSIGMNMGGSGASGTTVASHSTVIGPGVGEAAAGTGAANSRAASPTGCVGVDELGSPVEGTEWGSSVEAMRVVQSHLV